LKRFLFLWLYSLQSTVLLLRLLARMVFVVSGAQVPEVGKIYSFNEGNYEMWDEPTKAYISSLKDPSQWNGRAIQRPLHWQPGESTLRHHGQQPPHLCLWVCCSLSARFK